MLHFNLVNLDERKKKLVDLECFTALKALKKKEEGRNQKKKKEEEERNLEHVAKCMNLFCYSNRESRVFVQR
jgi:hypothetical protein